MTRNSQIVLAAAVVGALLLVVLAVVLWQRSDSPTVAPTAQSEPIPPSASSPSPSGTVAPKILVIDRALLLQASMVGQSMMKQAQALSATGESSLKGREAALRAEGAALQQQLAILAPAQKAAKIKDFEAKQAALQQDLQKQQSLIQGGVLRAEQQIEQTLGPILQAIMVERGANLLLDRHSVILGTVANLDITKTAVERLNQKLSTVTVVPTPLPPGATAPQ